MLTDSKIKTIIIEDNAQTQEYLSSILIKNLNSIEIVGFAISVEESIKLINKEKPELVFMDIELTDGYSFEIFNSISYTDFEVIFITAYDNYIKKAIDHYAFSFIMKPVNSSKLIEIVTRYISLKERMFTKSKYELLTNFITSKDSRFLIHVGNQHISIKVKDIIKCQADGNYTCFYLNNNKTYLASKSLKYYEGLLIEKGFFKAHRSVIINIDYISSIYKKETIILTNNDKVNVSVRNKSNLINLINKFS